MSPDSAAPTTPSFLAGRRKWAILLALVLILAVGALALLRRPSPATNTQTTNSASTNTASVIVNRQSFQQVTTPLVADADKDGLGDQRENELKTNIRLADTDGDQLSDYDEVEIYKSNPLKQDTDNDGYPDGDEVRTGNNPNGAGSLLNLPQTISNINAQ